MVTATGSPERAVAAGRAQQQPLLGDGGLGGGGACATATHTPPLPPRFTSMSPPNPPSPNPNPNPSNTPIYQRGSATWRPQRERIATTPTKPSPSPSPSIDAFERHSVTTQQSPTAKSRLACLVAFIYRSAQSRESHPAMAEALLGLAPSYGDAPSNKPSIARPDDLPAQLRRDLELKKTPTRCEHVLVTLEVPSTVEFAIRETDAEAPEANDPALAGVPTRIVEGQPVKVVRAYETIISQPHDNPAIQRSVAKHIVGLLSTADESTWVVREVSRGQYGWTFTYICKDSVAMWNRQVGKTANKALVGEYSQKELEPVISGRPAFDCRGTLTIAFSKNSRTINIKYEHTPFHKTVGEMIEHFRPLPPAAPPASLIPACDKPKKAKTPRKRKSEANGDGTPSQPKKKKRKTKSESAAAVSGQGAQEEAAGNDSSTATVLTKADAAVQSGVHLHAVLDVPPAEAARRREVAIRLLSDSGVDPESLSTEQFSIFANQSPDLQKESLAMLAKYGAERLRIVHPSDVNPASSTSAPPTSDEPAAKAGTADDPASSLESPAPTKKRRPRKSKAAAGDAEEEELIPAPAGTPLRQVSRGSCIACRRAKTKCDRAKPACSLCEEEGVECQYPLVKKQATKKKEEKSLALLDDDQNIETEAEAEPELEPETAPESEHEPAPEMETAPETEAETEEQEPDDIETIDYTSNMPVANMITPAAETPSQDYFNSGHNQLSYTHTASNDMGLSQSVSSYPETLVSVSYAEPSSLTDSTAAYTHSNADTANFVQPADTRNVGHSQAANAGSLGYHHQPATKSPQTTGTSPTTTRRSLPTGIPQQQPITESAVPLPNYAQNWQNMSPAKPTNTVSPSMSARQHRSRKSAQIPTPSAVSQQSAAANDNTQHIAAQAAMRQQQQQQQQHRPSPTQGVAQVAQAPRVVSPFQAPVQTVRAKSRAGHRASTRTPVNEQRPSPSHHTVQPSTTRGTLDTTTYNNNINNHNNNNNSSDTHSLGSVSNYNTYGAKYPSAGGNTLAEADTKLAYQPYAPQTTSAAPSTYTSYDHGRSSMIPQNNTSNLAYTPSNNPRSGQMHNSQTQTQSRHNTQQPYRDNTATETPTTNPYAQSSPAVQQQQQQQRQQQQQQQQQQPQQQSSTLQSFNMRNAATASQAMPSTRHKSQQQHQQQNQQQQQPSQSYGSYSSQTQQQPTQSDQHSWYGFGSGTNTSFPSANVSGGYAARGGASINYGTSSSSGNQAYQQQQQQQHHHQTPDGMPNHSYAGDDNDMYELLKNSLHGPGR